MQYEQGSSASQMTAETVMDKQPRWKMLPDCSKNPKSACPDVWTHLPRHKTAQIMDKKSRCGGFFRSKFKRRLAWSCGKDSSKKFQWNLDGKKCRIGNACLFIENIFSSVHVGEIKMVGKKKVLKDLKDLKVGQNPPDPFRGKKFRHEITKKKKILKMSKKNIKKMTKMITNTKKSKKSKKMKDTKKNKKAHTGFERLKSFKSRAKPPGPLSGKKSPT